MRSVARAALAAMLGTVLVTGAACTPAAEQAPERTPKITPPAIGEAGVLRAGVDLEYPPFAGTDDGREAGLDIDVAEAVAAELGLTLKTVQVEPSEAATALAEGAVDIVLSVPFNEEALLGSTIAGTYVTDGPAFFTLGSGDTTATGAPGSTEDTSASDAATAGGAPATVEPLTLADMRDLRVGAQDSSASFWLLEYELGEGAVGAYPTLREAFDALAAGQIDVVAADAAVGAYIARDFERVVFAGQIGDATPLGVAVAPDNAELETAVREALNTIAANGVLETVLSTWLGDLPELSAPGFGSSEGTETP